VVFSTTNIFYSECDGAEFEDRYVPKIGLRVRVRFRVRVRVRDRVKG